MNNDEPYDEPIHSPSAEVDTDISDIKPTPSSIGGTITYED